MALGLEIQPTSSEEVRPDTGFARVPSTGHLLTAFTVGQRYFPGIRFVGTTARRALRGP